MKHTLFSLLALMAISLSLSAQYTHKDFIITLDKDTVWGEWEENYTLNRGLRIEFVKDGMKQWYTADQILAYGKGTVYLREAHKVKMKPTKTGFLEFKNVFLECLIKGEVSLFSDTEKASGRTLYVLSPEDGIEPIYSKKEKVYVEDKIFTTKGDQYLPIMTRVMGDCYDPEDRIGRLGFSRKRVLAVFKDYYTCKNKPYRTYNYKRPKVKQVGLQVGYNPVLGDFFGNNDSDGTENKFWILGLVYKQTISRNPSIFLQLNFDYNLVNRNQHDLIPNQSSSIPRYISETHTFIPNISFGKTFFFKKSYLNTKGGFIPGFAVYRPFIEEEKFNFHPTFILLLDLGYGLDLGDNVNVEFYFNTFFVVKPYNAGLRLFVKL